MLTYDESRSMVEYSRPSSSPGVAVEDNLCRAWAFLNRSGEADVDSISSLSMFLRLFLVASFFASQLADRHLAEGPFGILLCL